MPQIEKRKIRFSFILDKIEPVLVIGIIAGVLWYMYVSFIQIELQKYLPGGEFHVTTEQVKLAEQQKYLKELGNFYSLYQKRTGGADVLAGTVPKYPESPGFFAGFEKIAADLGLGLEVVSITPPKGVEDKKKEKEKGSLKELVIAAKFTKVDYKKLKTLLNIFETNRRILDVQSIDADPASGSASFVIKTYYQEDYVPTTITKKETDK
ncbi:hypothetical protein HYW94_01735 [Candidatus Uhrbacteria bacterium]|nr:hypothetical protein [Candidatus Uhrbacteria bacterium]